MNKLLLDDADVNRIFYALLYRADNDRQLTKEQSDKLRELANQVNRAEEIQLI